MKYAWIESHQEEFPVQRLCEVLAVSRSGFYAWRARPESACKERRRTLAVQIRHVHERSRGLTEVRGCIGCS